MLRLLRRKFGKCHNRFFCTWVDAGGNDTSKTIWCPRCGRTFFGMLFFHSQKWEWLEIERRQVPHLMRVNIQIIEEGPCT